MSAEKVKELEELAASEGITLPMEPWLIIFFEKHGRVVNLLTGQVERNIAEAMPTRTGKTIAHLLAHETGMVKL